MTRYYLFRQGPGGVDRPDSPDDRFVVRDAKRDREVASNLTLAEAHRIVRELNEDEIRREDDRGAERFQRGVRRVLKARA